MAADEKLEDAMKVLALVKYYGDGMRWFNRRGPGNANYVVDAFLDFEKKHGIVEEASDEEVNARVAQR